MKTAVNHYNRRPHTITGHLPEFLHYGFKLPENITIEDIQLLTTELSRQRKKNRQLIYEKQHLATAFDISDLVLLLIFDCHRCQIVLTPRYFIGLTIPNKSLSEQKPPFLINHVPNKSFTFATVPFVTN